MTLDSAGLDALIADVEGASNESFRRDWLLLRLRYARSLAAAVPPTGENPRDNCPVNTPMGSCVPRCGAAMCEEAAGRAAATPDPPDAYTACVEALAEWWTGEATAAEVTGWMNGALQAARLPELDREAAISMCNMVMADLRGECDYGAVVSNVLRAAYPAATPDPPSDRNIARMFHEAYERLAPEFGYHTREESAVPWERVPARNRDLMTATVGEVRAHLAAASPDERLREAAERLLVAFAAEEDEHGFPFSFELRDAHRALVAATDRDKPETDT